jgi:hypothetical protein
VYVADADSQVLRFRIVHVDVDTLVWTPQLSPSWYAPGAERNAVHEAACQ